MQEAARRAVFEGALCSRVDEATRRDVSLPAHGDYTFDDPSFRRSCRAAGFPEGHAVFATICIVELAPFLMASLVIVEIGIINCLKDWYPMFDIFF